MSKFRQNGSAVKNAPGIIDDCPTFNPVIRFMGVNDETCPASISPASSITIVLSLAVASPTEELKIVLPLEILLPLTTVWPLLMLLPLEIDLTFISLLPVGVY